MTAPELVHLNPIIGLIENQFFDTRLGKELLPKGRSRGVTHRPFQMDFLNGSRILGRIPQRDGKGVKGVHPLWLELDEASDFPDPGWIEINETLKRGHEGAVWRAHGVTKGVRDFFYKYTQPDSGWKVHRYCLPGQTMIYGVNGPTPIAEIEPGTEVWTVTRDGQLSSDVVTARIDNGPQSTWRVRAKGGFDLVSTGNHPFLILYRGGTSRTRNELQFEWVSAENLCPGDYVIGVSELPGTSSRVPTFDEVTDTLCSHSPVRTVPRWVWEATKSMQLAFLHGYLLGDGSLSRQKRGQDPWQVGTASERMARELRSLCHYLGLRTTAIEVHDSTIGNGPQFRFYVYPDIGWFRQIPLSYSRVRDGQMLEGLGKNFVARRVESVVPTGEIVQTYDITVGEDHNFIAEGLVVHNTAMHRPTWTVEEREEKIRAYGSREHPDYRRNILGQHGDATNPLFVLHRLMQIVDQEQSSTYNTEEYQHYRINHEMLMDLGDQISNFLQYPKKHLNDYKVFWAGMDVGYTNHPSEILVFAEVTLPKQKPYLRLITRIHLERISHGSQVETILHTIRSYNVRGFSMDKTGLGLPLFQDIQERAPELAPVIKGYNFSSKILVDFDKTIEVDEYRGDMIKDSGIERNVLEYASDVLRELVDQERLFLPWDRDLLGQFQGQTYTVIRDTMNQYGKKQYSVGSFHALDAARMAVLGWKQHAIEEFTKEEKFEPVTDMFLTFE